MKRFYYPMLGYVCIADYAYCICLQARIQNSFREQAKIWGAKKILGEQSNVFRQEMFEILLKMTFN